MSITTVICHTGIQYSFHVQVKPLCLLHSSQWKREKGPSKGAGMTEERERGLKLRALLQSSPQVEVKKSIVEHEVSLMQQEWL